MFVGRNTPILGMLAKPGLLGIVSRAIAPDIAHDYGQCCIRTGAAAWLRLQ
jgi:hypothetical protein